MVCRKSGRATLQAGGSSLDERSRPRSGGLGFEESFERWYVDDDGMLPNPALQTDERRGLLAAVLPVEARAARG